MDAPAIPDDEEQRIESLHATDLLFTPAEERFDRITRLTAQFFDIPITLVSLVAERCQWFKSAHGLDATDTPRDVSFCGHAILGEATFVVEDALLDPRFADNPLVTGDPHIRFYAGQPLHTADGRRAGTLCMIDRQPRTLRKEQLRAFRDFAAIAETELQRGQFNEIQRELLRQRDELQRRIQIDSLTRMWSRDAIIELLGAEIARAHRGAALCVAMIDADHFKAINDNHGHPVGDAVLSGLSARIRGALREFDAVGRYGGEEFMAVLGNTTLEVATSVCERIRAAVADAAIETPFGRIAATISVGVAAWSPARQRQEQLIAAADDALYRAKAAGRNRVELAPAP